MKVTVHCDRLSQSFADNLKVANNYVIWNHFIRIGEPAMSDVNFWALIITVYLPQSITISATIAIIIRTIIIVELVIVEIPVAIAALAGGHCWTIVQFSSWSKTLSRPKHASPNHGDYSDSSVNCDYTRNAFSLLSLFLAISDLRNHRNPTNLASVYMYTRNARRGLYILNCAGRSFAFAMPVFANWY